MDIHTHITFALITLVKKLFAASVAVVFEKIGNYVILSEKDGNFEINDLMLERKRYYLQACFSINLFVTPRTRSSKSKCNFIRLSTLMKKKYIQNAFVRDVEYILRDIDFRWLVVVTLLIIYLCTLAPGT